MKTGAPMLSEFCRMGWSVLHLAKYVTNWQPASEHEESANQHSIWDGHDHAMQRVPAALGLDQ